MALPRRFLARRPSGSAWVMAAVATLVVVIVANSMWQAEYAKALSSQAAPTTAAAAAAAGKAKVPAWLPKPAEFPPSLFELALQDCKSLECVRLAHDSPKNPGQFNFPHFYMIGFQKCATTSLFYHLKDHPQTLTPGTKEPVFFTDRCNHNVFTCPDEWQERYFVRVLRLEEALKTRMTLAAFEGSTPYALAGLWLAPGLRAMMPWLKMVIAMREPISQALSMRHFEVVREKLTFDCYDGQNKRIFKCLDKDLDTKSRHGMYLGAWVKHFPRDQIHVVQFENVTGAGMEAALADLKRFIGVDPALPSTRLGHENYRGNWPDEDLQQHTGERQRNDTHLAPRSEDSEEDEGWPMTRREYLRLVSKARRNAEEIVEIIRKYGFADADAWMESWQRTWKRNLDSCGKGPNGNCLIKLND